MSKRDRSFPKGVYEAPRRPTGFYNPVFDG